MHQATDEDLVKAGRTQRSKTLAEMFEEFARYARCTCQGEHEWANRECPKAIWEEAARTARLTIEK